MVIYSIQVKADFFSVITPVFRVTWSFKNHFNMLIRCAWTFLIIINTESSYSALLFCGNNYTFFQNSLMYEISKEQHLLYKQFKTNLYISLTLFLLHSYEMRPNKIFCFTGKYIYIYKNLSSFGLHQEYKHIYSPWPICPVMAWDIDKGNCYPSP